jgi:hypothetical protein
MVPYIYIYIYIYIQYTDSPIAQCRPPSPPLHQDII